MINANRPRSFVTMVCSQEVYQEEPKEEPVGDIALPNSTSLAHSIAGDRGAVTMQNAQSSTLELVKYFVEP